LKNQADPVTWRKTNLKWKLYLSSISRKVVGTTSSEVAGAKVQTGCFTSPDAQPIADDLSVI